MVQKKSATFLRKSDSEPKETLISALFIAKELLTPSPVTATI